MESSIIITPDVISDFMNICLYVYEHKKNGLLRPFFSEKEKEILSKVHYHLQRDNTHFSDDCYNTKYNLDNVDGSYSFYFEEDDDEKIPPVDTEMRVNWDDFGDKSFWLLPIVSL